MWAATPSLGSDYESEAYIKSHFFYGEVARIGIIQKSPIPDLPRAEPCSTDVLPAAPGQFGKRYYVDALITFPNTSKIHTQGKKPAKLPSMDKDGVSTYQQMCKLENKNSPISNPATGTRWCLAARVGRYLLMADSFFDSCGNLFYGFWESATVMDSYVHGKPQYTSIDEHSVTTSLGRFDGMEKDERFSGAYNGIPGPTGEVPVKRFLFFQKATERDLEEVEKQIASQISPNGPYFRCRSGHFQTNPDYCGK